MCRPQTDPSLYAELAAYEGDVLLDYVEPVDTILRISGLKLAGTAEGGGGPLPENVVVQGGDATLGTITADELIVGNVRGAWPRSPEGLPVGDIYVDENGFVKVVI
ncbi:hypothetical protein MWMV4_MWMV4_03658 [Acinetobacter baumannii]|nr:hypothetical protein MWMV4_MWMV4_03658 [Acinetobacter baumannii]